MERRLKERLIGAAVLVMLAVIFIPMILDNSSDNRVAITRTNIPERPAEDFNSRIIPLKGADLTTVHEAVQAETDTRKIIKQRKEPAETKILQTSSSDGHRQTVTAQTGDKPVVSNHMGTTAWVVQLGSFSSEKNAKGLNEKLRLAGFPAFVEPLKRKSGMAYRVRVGPELLRSDAQNLQQKLKKNMHIDGIIIRYP